MKKLNCFIASAFGHKDVDNIFINAIKPILSELKITPYRVDKINHNSKIDSKILELITKCDFGIADLTYARPSVYYEAGFIEGLSKEVIYICKNDHFSPKESDIFGNEKIHFDLITKNIISWSDSIANFRKKLRSRIIIIQNPILRLNTKSSEELKSQTEFKSMPHNQRLQLLTNELKNNLLKNKFKEIKKRFYYNIYQKGKVRVCINIHESAKEAELRHLRYTSRELSENGKFKILTINCYIKPVPKSRIERSLGFYKPMGENIYQWEEFKIKIIDSINSLYKLKQNLKSLKIS